MKKIILLLMLSVIFTSVFGQITYRWHSSLWTTGNFFPVGIPGLLDSVYMSGLSANCTLDVNIHIRSFHTTNTCASRIRILPACTMNVKQSLHFAPSFLLPQLIGTIALNGTSGPQRYTNNFGNITIARLIVDNPDGVIFDGTGNTFVEELVMVQGNIYVDSPTTLTVGSSIAIPGTLTHTAGKITGPGAFARWFGTSTTTNTLFPWGTTTGQDRKILLSWTTAPMTGGRLTTRHPLSSPGSTGLPVMDASYSVDNVASDGYWTITNSGIAGGQYDLQISAEGFPYGNPTGDLRLIKRANASSNWMLEGIHVAGSTIPTIARSGLTSFSDFGLGYEGTPLVLPSLRFWSSGLTLYWDVGEVDVAEMLLESRETLVPLVLSRREYLCREPGMYRIVVTTITGEKLFSPWVEVMTKQEKSFTFQQGKLLHTASVVEVYDVTGRLILRSSERLVDIPQNIALYLVFYHESGEITRYRGTVIN